MYWIVCTCSDVIVLINSEKAEVDTKVCSLHEINDNNAQLQQFNYPKTTENES